MTERASAPPAGVWPFLVTRGRRVGYRAVLAPPFLVDRGLHYMLIHAAAVEHPTPHELLRREVNDDTTGDYTLVFRVVPADPGLVGQSGKVLRDEASRPVDIIEGVVLTGQDPVLQDTAIDAAHEVIVEVFRDFWQSDDPYATPVRAKPLQPQQVRRPVDSPSEPPVPLPARRHVALPPVAQPPAPRPPVSPGPVDHDTVSRRRRRRLSWLIIIVVAALAIVAVLVVTRIASACPTASPEVPGQFTASSARTRSCPNLNSSMDEPPTASVHRAN
jgi:hypothetical protein